MTLFLDIDDTLNNVEGYLELQKELNDLDIKGDAFKNSEYSLIFEGFISIGCQESLEKLNQMIDEYKIDNIVMCSSWKNLGIQFIKFMFYLRGFKNVASLITDATPNLEAKYMHATSAEIRTQEILEYVKIHNIGDYIILDDMPIDIPNHYLVKLDSYKTPIGLDSKFELLKNKEVAQ